jgi:hypothetical protein
MKKTINKLPQKFKWTLHNVVAHPLMEITHLLGFTNLSKKIHDSTCPDEIDLKENIDSIMNPERND